jgi:membrane-bound lytic murein transglycosylase B
VAPSDIPRVFLDAYRQAASALEVRAPGCRVGATALAAVGKVESDHGRQQGAVLALNGDVLPRIVGIALDGTAGTAVVDDTDGGRVDGDPVHDRAVGPMQFIPSTWQQFAQDGNGDGLDNVNNAYDAALATATYLCRAVPAGGLDVEAGLRPALLSYNRSPSYVDKVLTWVRTYDALAGGLPAAAG